MIPRERFIWMLISLTALPVVGVLVFVAWFYVDIPFSDQWQATVPLLEKLYRGELTLTDWVSQHNEHRPLFHRLIWLPLAWATHWNTTFEVAATLLFGLATLGILLWQAAKTARQFGQGPVTWVWPAIAWLFFSMSQYETWLQSYLLHWVLHVFAVVTGLTLLAQASLKPSHIVLAIGLGIVSTFTVASGVLFWPIGFALLWRNRLIPAPVSLHRYRVAWSGLWIAMALLVALIYLSGFQMPLSQPQPANEIGRLVGLSLYFLTWLGAPVLIYTGSLILGLLGVGAFAWVLCGLWRRDGVQHQHLLPYLAYAAFALTNGLLISVVRADMGWQQALSPRYIIISALFWIALAMFLQIHYWSSRTHGRGQRLAKGLIVGMICMAVISWLGGAYMGLKHRHWPMLAARQALRDGREDDAVLLQIHNNPAQVRELLPVLKAHQLSLYRCRTAVVEEQAHMQAMPSRMHC